MPDMCMNTVEIDDIEDIVKLNDFERQPAEQVISHVKFINKLNTREETVKCDSIIPGAQTIFIKTWGCAHNNSDGEYMAGQLQTYGYKITDDKYEADLWLLNSCTVKNPAVDHFRNEIESARNLRKYIVLAGCVPQASPKLSFLNGLSIIGVQQIDRVIEVVEETLKGHSVRLLGQKKRSGKKLGGASLNLPKIRKNPLIEIIPINTGCLNQCTYCKTKHARGNLGSYPPEEIISRAKQSFEDGVVELWLTSEDTGTYGRDIGISLPELLWRLVEVIPNNCMMRIGMTNPPYILEYLEEIGKVLSHPRVYSFIHIPVQSGSDKVLYDMKREYTVDDFQLVVDTLKKSVSGITVATDIICGFPTETESDFDETLQLCEKYKFSNLFMNQFYPRPGTPAARLPRIPAQQVKHRTKRLDELFRSYEPYSHKLNEIQTVLVTEEAHDELHYVAHNKYYEQVLVPRDPYLMGKCIQVKITKTMKHCMIGSVLNRNKYSFSRSMSTIFMRYLIIITILATVFNVLYLKK